MTTSIHPLPKPSQPPSPAKPSEAGQPPVKPPFRPWLRDLKRAGVLAGCAGLAAYLAWSVPTAQASASDRHIQLLVYVLAGMAAWASLHLVRRALARRQGKLVERASAKVLRRNLAEDVPIFETGVPIPPQAGGGDADIVVGDGTRKWVVEVKSHINVRVASGWFGRTKIVRGNGARAFRRNPLAQVLRHAQYLHAQPVVWFPRARVASIGEIDGVVVVTGGVAGLMSATGMPRRRWLG